MRRYAFGIVGTALALVVLPCLLLLTVDMEERRIAPLAGRWASVLHPGATADIRRGPECYILTLRRPGDGFRHGRTFRLRYRRGIYYLDAGRRVELYTLCYRRLVQDAVVTLRHHRLLFGEEEDCGANRVEYDPATDRLTLGCYGLFLPDDATHPAAEEFETPVE